MEGMFKYSMKPSDDFFRSNDEFHAKFTAMRNQAREVQAKQAKYSPLMNYIQTTKRKSLKFDMKERINKD